MKYVDARTKVKIICPKHGPFYQTPHHHMLGQKCIKCFIETRTKNNKKHNASEQGIEKWKNMLKERYPNLSIDFSKVKSIDIPVEVVCKLHGSFQKTIHSLFRPGENGCRKCNNNSPKRREEFITKSKELHGDLLDYSKLDMNDLKPTFICKKHNVEFTQEKRNHLVYNGCPKCIYEMQALTPEKFIERANEIHGNKYDYSKTKYTRYYDKITVTCPIHGDFIVIAGEHIRNPSSSRRPIGCRKCFNRNKSELAVMHYLDSIGVKYHYQFKLPQYRFRWDFVIDDLMLNIELDDDTHLTHASTIKHDPVKDTIMEVLGYDVVRIKDTCATNTIKELKKILPIYFKEKEEMQKDKNSV